MIIVGPQMNSFLTRCNMGFPSEDCRIYDIHYMWPILLVQTLLCLIVIAIKSIMVRRAYSLYWYLHEFKSPLLKYIHEGRYLHIDIPADNAKSQ